MTSPLLIESAIYQSDGAAVVRVGQTAVLDFMIAAPGESGPFAPADLSGRFFVQRLIGRDGALLAEVEPTRPNDHTVRFTLAVTDDLLPADAVGVDLDHALVELLEDDEDEILVRPFSIRRLRSGKPAAMLQVGPAERLVVRYVGEVGASAAQQIRDAGLIEVATGDALAEWLRAPAVEAAEAADAAAGRADAAAEGVNAAGNGQLAQIADAGAFQLDAVAGAGATERADIVTAGGLQTAAVNAAGQTQRDAIEEEGGAKVAAVGAAGLAVMADIAAAGLMNGGVFPDTASGLAASAEGDVFVVAAGADLIIYREESAAAVEKGRIKSAAFINALDNRLKASAGADGLIVKGKFNKTFLHVTEFDIDHPAFNSLVEQVATAIAATEALKPHQVGIAGFQLKGRFNKTFLHITETVLDHLMIRDHAARLEALEAGGAVPLQQVACEPIEGALLTTQLANTPSLSQSNGQGPQTTIITAGTYGFIRMFTRIIYNSNPPFSDAWASALQTAQELVYDGHGETGHLVMARTMSEQWPYLTGATFDRAGREVVVSNFGGGGLSAAQLTGAGGHIENLLAAIPAAHAAASAEGKTLSTPSIEYDQGEQDMVLATPPATWKGQVAPAPSRVRAAQLAASGLDRPVIGVMIQTGKHATFANDAAREAAWQIACAQLELAEQHPDWVLGAVTYPLTYYDGTHIETAHQRVKRAYVGRARAYLHARGVRPPHLRISRWAVAGDTVTFDFVPPVGGLVLDRTAISDPAGFNGGVSIRDAANNPITVLGLTQTGNSVAVQAAVDFSTIPGCRVLFGREGTGATDSARSGPLYGGRTIFRDQAGDAPGGVFEPGGIAWPLHNWLPLQQIIIN